MVQREKNFLYPDLLLCNFCIYQHLDKGWQLISSMPFIPKRIPEEREEEEEESELKIEQQQRNLTALQVARNRRVQFSDS
jgi:hypothetical protein